MARRLLENSPSKLPKKHRSSKHYFKNIYNACHVGGGDNSDILLFSDITDTSKLAQILHPSVSYSGDKQELIEAYLLSKCSAEELRLLELDMTNVIQYHERRVEVLTTAVCNPSDISEIGALSVLHNHLQEGKASAAEM